jgi:LytR cell envelope-related transcriptional attenuator
VQQAYSIEAVRPWRTAALVASALAAAELVLLLVGGVVAFGLPVAHVRARTGAAPPHQRAKSPPPPPRPPMLARAQVPVLVLNANGLAGAAADAADDVRVLSYPVSGVGNADDQTRPRSVVMYAPSFDREARRLANEIHVAIVSPLDGIRPRALTGAKLLLLVGG